MSEKKWHLDEQLAERYASGQTGQTLSASIEQHLIVCATCRDMLTPLADVQRGAAVWTGVLERVQAPAPGLVERLLRRCGVAESTSRLLAVTPSLRGSWLTGVVFVIVLAQLAAHSTPSGVAFYMALAPVLPLISVAVAFDGELDQSREMAAATPYSALRLLLIRTAAVVTSTLVPVAFVALLLPGSVLLALGWLVPSLALIGAVMILMPYTPALPTAGIFASSWMALVAAGWLRHHDPYLAVSFTVQVVSAGVLMTTLVLFLVRKDSFAEEIRRPA